MAYSLTGMHERLYLASSSPRSPWPPPRGCGSRCARSATCARIAARCRACSPRRSRSPRTRRPPTTPWRRRASASSTPCSTPPILLALTLGGALQWLADLWARAFAVESLWHGTALILSVFLLKGVLGLPLDLYRIFVVEERFGFNRMTPRLYFTDLVKHLLVGAVLGIPLLLVDPVADAGRRARCGGCTRGLVLVAYSLFLQMIYPAVVMPLFNKFSPLSDPVLAARVEELLRRTGFRSRGLYVMDGSKRSSHGNAFFTGFGAAKRIVLFDTLVVAPAAGRGRGGARPRARALQAAPRGEGHGAQLGVQLRFAVRCSACSPPSRGSTWVWA